jgi:hypothetical protein
MRPFYVYFLLKRLHSKFDGRFESPPYKIFFEISPKGTPPKDFKYLATIIANSYDEAKSKFEAKRDSYVLLSLDASKK